LVLILGALPATPVAAPTPSTIASVTATPLPSETALTVSPSATPTTTATPAIPPGYRVKIPRLAIDLPIAEGDIERDTVRQETPDNFAFHFPGTAIPGDRGNSYIYAHARRGMFLALWSAREGD
jgi:sortase (surface protein transpeptidase)